jgi:hypothetical protein
MPKYSILTIDLKDSEETARDKFHAGLADDLWEPVGGGLTTWSTVWQDKMPDPAILLMIKMDLMDLAEAARINGFEAVVAITATRPKVFGLQMHNHGKSRPNDGDLDANAATAGIKSPIDASPFAGKPAEPTGGGSRQRQKPGGGKCSGGKTCPAPRNTPRASSTPCANP